ncbi:MAG: hypothetical protein NC203_05020 [Firmicutes bacterium]|nr:hypothetical protein [[Eubacterium] siraeum]MCM1487712.1 hypothetical protein [Bacillota bacterium]
MENNKTDKLPKNDFARLDKLEREEHLDKGGSAPEKNPMTVMPLNALYTFPVTAMGYPNAAPITAPFYDYKTDDNDEKRR